MEFWGRRLARSVLVACLLGCPAQTTSQSTDPKTDAVTLHEPDDGQRVSLRLGEHLEVRLVEQPGTGFAWTVASTPPVLELLEDAVRPLDDPSPGARTERLLLWRAMAAGGGEIELIHRRPWEKDKEPVRRIRLRVQIE